MKSKIDFSIDTIQTATIIANIERGAHYRELLINTGAIIEKDHVNNSENIVVFLVKDLKVSDLHLFDLNHRSECYVHYYEINTGKFLLKFYTSDNYHFNKHISQIYISKIYKDGEETKTRSICDICEVRPFEAEHPAEYTINWGGCGSMTVDVTKNFTEGLSLAVQLAEECTSQFVK